MRVGGIVMLVLAGLGTLVAINNVFLGGSQSAPQGESAFVGYAVGSFLLPIIFAVVGLKLLEKSKE